MSEAEIVPRDPAIAHTGANEAAPARLETDNASLPRPLLRWRAQ